MGLKDRATKEETTEETVIDTTMEEVTPEVVEEKTPEVVETKEVAVKQDAPAPAKAKSAGVKELCVTHEDLVAAVADAEYGDFPSIVASNGNHMVTDAAGDKVSLGETLKFQVLVVNNIYKMIPGSDDDDAKQYFGASSNKDDLLEKLEEAKADGYKKAEIKLYKDVICVITDCDKNSDAWVSEMCTLQLAQTSQWGWDKLYKQVRVKLITGKAKAKSVYGDAEEFGKAVEFTSTATPTTSKGGNSYTKFVFSV